MRLGGGKAGNSGFLSQGFSSIQDSSGVLKESCCWILATQAVARILACFDENCPVRKKMKIFLGT